MRRVAAAALAMISICAAPMASAQGNSSQGKGETVRETHGAWQVLCPTTGEGGCEMAQIGKDGQGNSVIAFRVRKIEPRQVDKLGEVIAVLRIFAPIGVNLAAGLGYKVDSNDPRRGEFLVCSSSECMVQQPANAQIINELKRGANVTLSVLPFNAKQRVDSTLSLSGFTAAFDALKP